MKENDWQLLRCHLFWLFLLFMVVLSFYGIFRLWENFFKNFAANFSSLFHLHCYSQVTSVFTFISVYSVKILFLKCRRSIALKKLLVTFVVPKLQSFLLRVTRGFVRLVHCVVLLVTISSQNPKMIWFIIFLKSTAPQTLMLLQTVNLVIKSFKAFTPYVNIKTPNMALLSRWQMLINEVDDVNL